MAPATNAAKRAHGADALRAALSGGLPPGRGPPSAPTKPWLLAAMCGGGRDRAETTMEKPKQTREGMLNVRRHDVPQSSLRNRSPDCPFPLLRLPQTKPADRNSLAIDGRVRLIPERCAKHAQHAGPWRLKTGTAPEAGAGEASIAQGRRANDDPGLLAADTAVVPLVAHDPVLARPSATCDCTSSASRPTKADNGARRGVPSNSRRTVQRLFGETACGRDQVRYA